MWIMVAMHGAHLLLAVVFMRGWGDLAGWGLNGYAVAFLLSDALGLSLHLGFWHRRMGLHPQAHHWWALPMRVIGPVVRIGLPGAA